jgi:hypothetical protein
VGEVVSKEVPMAVTKKKKSKSRRSPKSGLKGLWYHFRQNNSGGSWDVDLKTGIGIDVWI